MTTDLIRPSETLGRLSNEMLARLAPCGRDAKTCRGCTESYGKLVDALIKAAQESALEMCCECGREEETHWAQNAGYHFYRPYSSLPARVEEAEARYEYEHPRWQNAIMNADVQGMLYLEAFQATAAHLEEALAEIKRLREIEWMYNDLRR